MNALDFTRPHRYLDVPGGRLAYWRFGRGPNLVLVHGWPVSAATFRHLAPFLEPRFTLHLVDLPGAGLTEWSGPIEMASHATTVRRAIDQLGLESYALMAHDSGGTIARFVAADDVRVRGLVLAGTEMPGHVPALVRFYSWAAKHPRLIASLLSTMRYGAIRRSFLGFGGVFRDPHYADGEFGKLFVEPLAHSPKVQQSQMALMRTLDFGLFERLREAHARIAAPVLCIWGTDDPFFPIEKARRMLSQFAGTATLVEIPGGKLFVQEEDAEAFAAHAIPLLERCLPSFPT